MKRENTFIENALFDLLRISLWSVPPSIDYSNLSNSVWFEIYRLSGNQGVRNLVFEGVSRLPLTMQPDEKLLLVWAANTILAKGKYLRHVEAVKQLNNLCSAAGIDMVLFKGCALANCYPIPEYREYGDIDIYLQGKHALGDSLLKQKGTWIKEVDKHSAFIFQGIPVENHITFIDPIGSSDIFSRERKQAFEMMEKALQEILNEEQLDYLSRCDVGTPSATFNFLFMIMHTGTHLGKELVVRHICDWACFLVANKGKYDERKIERLLDKMDFRKLCLIMTDIAIRYVGMPVEYAPSFYQKGKRTQINRRFVDSLFFHFPGADEVKKNTLWCKWKRFYNRQWAYDLFYKEYLPERLCRTTIVWMKEECKKTTLNKKEKY